MEIQHVDLETAMVVAREIARRDAELLARLAEND